MTHSKPSTDVLNATELARSLRMNRKRIYLAIERGELRAFRVGRWYRILPEDRDRWIESLAAATRQGAS